MKTLIKTVACLLLGFGVNAQTETQLAEWQADNPSKLVMSRANYERLDTEQQQLIKSTVVFKEDIGFGIFGIEDTSLSEFESANYSEKEFIKAWMSEHKDLKIVTRSEYNASEPAIQAIYDKRYILVLIGDVLTKQDILNY